MKTNRPERFASPQSRKIVMTSRWMAWVLGGWGGWRGFALLFLKLLPLLLLEFSCGKERAKGLQFLSTPYSNKSLPPPIPCELPSQLSASSFSALRILPGRRNAIPSDRVGFSWEPIARAPSVFTDGGERRAVAVIHYFPADEPPILQFKELPWNVLKLAA